jgi:CDP-glucose 4,6-dehydratase
MEGKEMSEMFDGIYRGKRVLVTGHCGFKGTWCCQWLRRLGAEVIGYGHPPNTNPNHHGLLGWLPEGSVRDDLRDIDRLEQTFIDYKPDLVIHLAAKAIIARTFTEPQQTFENNLMGGVNILEAVRNCKSVMGIVFVTTDKIYENREWNYAYRENDDLGGIDPYSASKVCLEHVVRCYRESFGVNVAVARAGNVIGGGDWSYKRLIPDIVRAASKGKPTIIHTPEATRPWQHVLEALQGYLLLGQHILEGKDVSRAWNFGPEGEMTVKEVLDVSHNVWPAVQYEVDDTPTHPHMVYLLKIDSTESRKLLGWRPVWKMRQAVARTIYWYERYYRDGHIETENDIRYYERIMK